MDHRLLPRADLQVSVFGLGTMTFGEQTPSEDAWAQLDLARESGITLIDTAEMYPSPPRQSTQGESERLVGQWMAARSCRGEMVVSTKATAPDRGMGHIREGCLSLTAPHLSRAVEGSLRRLHTDYIDLYQVHWPERRTTNFGCRDYLPGNGEVEDETSLEETLAALADLQRTGKIRHIGLSNETPWGVMRALRWAEDAGFPSLVSVQNPYNLLSRMFDAALAEVSHREGVPLLAYSPLAFGKLTGKYLHGNRPEDSRLARYPRFSRFNKPAADQAIQAYAKVARDAGMSLLEMSLAFVRQNPLVGSVLLGASTRAQLGENLAATRRQLTPEILGKIEKIHQRYPSPCP